MIRTEYSEKNIDTEKKRPYKYWFVQNVYDREKDCRYFFAANMNAMIKWNCHENTTEIVYKTDGEPVRNELYGSGVINNGVIYFPPRQAEHMLVYDTSEKKADMVTMYPTNPYMGIRFSGSPYGYISVSSGEHVFFLYRESPICVEMSRYGNKINYISCAETGRSCILAKDYVLINGICYIPSISENSVCILNLDTEKLSFARIGNDNWRFGSVVYDGKYLWLLRIDADYIVRWNPQNNETENYSFFKKQDGCQYNNGYNLIYWNKKLYIVPGLRLSVSDSAVMSLNPLDGSVKQYEVFGNYSNSYKWPVEITENRIYYIVFDADEQYIYKSGRIRYIYLDVSDLSIHEFKIPEVVNLNEQEISDSIIDYQMRVLSCDCGYLDENLINNLEDYISYIRKNDDKSNIAEVSEYGKKIYNAVKT